MELLKITATFYHSCKLSSQLSSLGRIKNPYVELKILQN